MIAALLIGVIGAAVHYLSYHAVITQWLWSRYPQGGFFDKLFSCAACTGTWVGLGMAAYFRHKEAVLLEVAHDDPFLFVAAGAIGMVVTPLITFAHLGSLNHGVEEQP